MKIPSQKKDAQMISKYRNINELPDMIVSIVSTNNN